MTTIAWDSRTGTIAADRLSSGHLNPFCKLHRLPEGGGVVAGSGSCDWILAAVAWLSKKGDKPDVPADSISLLRVTPDGTAFVYGSALIPVPVALPFYAIGSGAPYAMAAMHCGKTPREAVEVAAAFDYKTGRGIDAWSVDERGAR